MDKNKQNYSKTSNSSKSCLSDSRKVSSDLQSNKQPWPRNSRRIEQATPRNNNNSERNKHNPSFKVRPNVDKRPPRRGGGDSYASSTDDVYATSSGLAATTGSLALNKYDEHDWELNSVYAPGSKKQNLNHLLNFHYAPRESEHFGAGNLSVFGRGVHHKGNGGVGAGKKQRYNKEQFLQANFQFVIKSSAKPKCSVSPDILIDWQLIEQINIQTTEEPQCPICLYPPIAAKLTRCGHAYCWPCILHYLALSDKSWRKCPICYEAIHIADLKSTTIVQQHSYGSGEEITLQLMRRKKGSLHIEKFKNAAVENMEQYPWVTGCEERKLFSKFLIAKKADVLNIIERERKELTTDDDSSCPEFVFIQQALDLLKERHEKLGNIEPKDERDEEIEIENSIDLTSNNPKIANNENIDLPSNDILTDITENNEAFEENSELSSQYSSFDLTTSTTLNTNKYYYFYQCQDGQNIYLHPLNVKMLQACYGTLDQAPNMLTARILQKEQHSMIEETRRKFTCLSHLPLTCQFAVVELDLQPPLVTEDIFKVFKQDILYRKKERQRRERNERKREIKINEINDRQMGKLISSTANINLESTNEFPMCGFEETLPNSSPTSSAALNRNSTSYSTVAVVGECSAKVPEYWPTLSAPSTSQNSFQELSTWRSSANRRTSERSSECDSLIEVSDTASLELDGEFLPPQCTKLSDVLEQAMSQKKQNKTKGQTTGNKKNKKGKKILLPLFSTGMNFNGN